MSNPTPEQIAKLPKWAKDHIQVLTNELELAASQLAKISDAASTGIHWKNGLGVNNPIPSGSQVVFKIPNEQNHRNAIRCKLVTEIGVTYLNINADDSIRIIPRVSNSIHIKLD